LVTHALSRKVEESQMALQAKSDEAGFWCKPRRIGQQNLQCGPPVGKTIGKP